MRLKIGQRWRSSVKRSRRKPSRWFRPSIRDLPKSPRECHRAFGPARRVADHWGFDRCLERSCCTEGSVGFVVDRAPINLGGSIYMTKLVRHFRRRKRIAGYVVSGSGWHERIHHREIDWGSPDRGESPTRWWQRSIGPCRSTCICRSWRPRRCRAIR